MTRLDKGGELLEKIGEAAQRKDWEAAHVYEDELSVLALRAIVAGDPSAKTLAKGALRMLAIDHPRWYA